MISPTELPVSTKRILPNYYLPLPTTAMRWLSGVHAISIILAERIFGKDLRIGREPNVSKIKTFPLLSIKKKLNNKMHSINYRQNKS